MDAQLKAKWIEALRSEEYRQARGALCKDGAYCCLGVLATLANLEITSDGQSIEGADSRADTYEGILTRLLGGFDHSQLTRRNDGSDCFDAHSFAQIADYIDREIP